MSRGHVHRTTGSRVAVMHGACGMRMPEPVRANTGRPEMWHVADGIVLPRPCHAACIVRMTGPVCCPGTLLRMPELGLCLFQGPGSEYLVLAVVEDWPFTGRERSTRRVGEVF